MHTCVQIHTHTCIYTHMHILLAQCVTFTLKGYTPTVMFVCKPHTSCFMLFIRWVGHLGKHHDIPIATVHTLAASVLVYVTGRIHNIIVNHSEVLRSRSAINLYGIHAWKLAALKLITITHSL